MSKPAVVFSLGFEYDWKIGGYDYLEYMSRPEAFKIGYHLKDEYKDFIDYMSNKEKSDGLFDSEKDFLTAEDKDVYRATEMVSREEGCPKYFGVISFDNEFLKKHGILQDDGLRTDKLKEIGRSAIAELINKSSKLDPSNVYWNAAIHTNTDNIHIHYSIAEYHRLENRKQTRRDKDMLEVEAFDALKSRVISKLVGNDYTKKITSLVRETLLPELAEQMIHAAGSLEELKRLIPPNIPKQYGRKPMEPYRTAIDQVTDAVIFSSPTLKEQFSQFERELDEQTEVLRELYGEGKRESYKTYKQNRLSDFYQSAGNLILNNLQVPSNEQCATVAQQDAFETECATMAQLEDLPPEPDFYPEEQEGFTPELEDYLFGGEFYETATAVPQAELPTSEEATAERNNPTETECATVAQQEVFETECATVAQQEVFETECATVAQREIPDYSGNEYTKNFLAEQTNRRKQYKKRTYYLTYIPPLLNLRRMQFEMERHMQQLKAEHDRALDYQIYVDAHRTV